jgi:hypothetical protein
VGKSNRMGWNAERNKEQGKRNVEARQGQEQKRDWGGSQTDKHWPTSLIEWGFGARGTSGMVW